MSLKNDYSTKRGALLKISSMQGDLNVEFPAFLTSLQNNFSSTWNEEKVYGRIDPIGTFQGTSRKISLSFNIVSENVDEARENLEKINKMTRMLYPSYSGAGSNALVLSKAPMVTIQFANLIQEEGRPLLGWINSWSANPVLDMGMYTPEVGVFLPKIYEASIDFTPQHKQDLAFNAGENSKPVNFPFKP